jgi:hypothetical protein
VIASFPLARDQIDRIKDAVAEPGTQQRPLSFVAASALAWVCLPRSRSVGVDGAARSHMQFSFECRSRLAPPLPAEYFGKCLRAMRQRRRVVVPLRLCRPARTALARVVA